MAKRHQVTLTAGERVALDRLMSRGKADARKLAHARVPLQADAPATGPGWADAAVAEAVRMSVRIAGRGGNQARADRQFTIASARIKLHEPRPTV